MLYSAFGVQLHPKSAVGCLSDTLLEGNRNRELKHIDFFFFQFNITVSLVDFRMVCNNKTEILASRSEAPRSDSDPFHKSGSYLRTDNDSSTPVPQWEKGPQLVPQ